MIRLMPAAMFAGLAFAQGAGSISGVVRESTSGMPMEAVSVTLFDHDLAIKQIYTDHSGRYSSTDVGSGQIRVHAAARGVASVDKTVSVTPGQNLVCDISVAAPGQISGKVTGEDGKPIEGLRVSALSTDYQFGARWYVEAGFATTDAGGEYAIDRAEPGRAYIVFAKKMLQRKAISGPLPDPEKRQPVLMPAYYPGADTIESATRVTLAPGEKREFIDIQMRRVPPRCLEGTVHPRDGAGAVRFEIQEAEPDARIFWAPAVPPVPKNWTAGTRAIGRMPPAGSVAGPDGAIRVCDLHPGDYILKTYSTGSDTGALGKDSMSASMDLATESVTIADRDVSGIAIGPQPQPDLRGDVIWDGKPRDDPGSMRLIVELTAATSDLWDVAAIATKLPFHFSLPVRNENYSVSVHGVPPDAYVKDVIAGGRSYLNEVFPAAAATEGLQVILGRDGARISVRAADQDGNVVPGAAVVIMPAGANTEAAMATAMITGETDATGAWTSPAIAPGKYYVIATRMAMNRSVDMIARLWRARARAEMVEADPGAVLQLNRVAVPVE